MSLDLSVIILTFNEELHIGRAIENVKDIARNIFIIDSYSTDRTVEIAKSYDNVTVMQNKWENNYAKQFNWGLANAPIKTKWVLRLDADEYLSLDLIKELQDKLPSLSDDITGITLKRRRIFMNKWLSHGGYPVKMLRIFCYGKGFCEQRLMDEHIQIMSGEVLEMDNDFCDHNLNNLSWLCHKHVDYAIREAADLLDIELGITGAALTDKGKNISAQAEKKRKIKHKYARQPLFWRSFAYFLYRFIIKGGWRDGKEGFIYIFIQGWWYRTLVDSKIFEIKRICGTDPNMIKQYISSNYNVSFEFDYNPK